MTQGRYDYEELLKKAVPGDKQAVSDLGAWFERYGVDYWNGEYYDIENGYRLYPIYKEVGEDDFQIVGYEIR